MCWGQQGVKGVIPRFKTTGDLIFCMLRIKFNIVTSQWLLMCSLMQPYIQLTLRCCACCVCICLCAFGFVCAALVRVWLKAACCIVLGRMSLPQGNKSSTCNSEESQLASASPPQPWLNLSGIFPFTFSNKCIYNIEITICSIRFTGNILLVSLSISNYTEDALMKSSSTMPYYILYVSGFTAIFRMAAFMCN